MIFARAIVKGEPDTLPFTADFQYHDKSDEQIFYNSVQMIKEKVNNNLKINTNEALVLYCACIVDALRQEKSVQEIQEYGSKILSANKVMIGVPETLRRITFDVTVDKLPTNKIILDQPIPITNFV